MEKDQSDRQATGRPRGPWDHVEPVAGGRAPHPRGDGPAWWKLCVFVMALVAAITALVIADRRGAFAPASGSRADAGRPVTAEDTARTDRTPSPLAPPSPDFDPRYDLPRPAAPIGSDLRWFSTADYPDAALKAGLEGRTRIGFTIGIDGHATACRILQTSGAPILDTTTCGLIQQRGRYWPARDASGEPVASEATRSVRWVLPAE